MTAPIDAEVIRREPKRSVERDGELDLRRRRQAEALTGVLTCLTGQTNCDKLEADKDDNLGAHVLIERMTSQGRRSL